MRRPVVLAAALAVTACAGDPPGSKPTPISEQELRVVAMQLLQNAVAAEMRFYAAEGRFTDDGRVLGTPAIVSGSGTPQSAGTVTVELCQDDRIVLLTTRAVEGTLFSLKARGLRPTSAGVAEFGHYTSRPACDATAGPPAWPGGYYVSRTGLQRQDGG